MTSRAIFVTDRDFWPLQALVRARGGDSPRDGAHIGKLADELARSIPFDEAKAPPDIITMHSRVLMRDLDSGATDTYTLVYPHQSDLTRGRLSVLAPLGTALLGFRQGAQIVWEMPGGIRRLHIERVWPAALQTPPVENTLRNRSAAQVRIRARSRGDAGEAPQRETADRARRGRRAALPAR